MTAEESDRNMIVNCLYGEKPAFPIAGFFIIGILFAWLAVTIPVNATEKTSESVVIVIDPGHGGDNLGTMYGEYVEMDMTLTVALAMKEELEKYEGITVYLTREDDRGLSLTERADYAASVQADFMFCLHFNASTEHNLYGTECWVSAFGEYYSKGYSFALTEMELLTQTGLYSRGIKTRIGEKGTDYYGIIRQSVAHQIPCVLIEHCHLDNANDQPYYDHSAKLKEFGRIDATAVAKYFHLYSPALQQDFRNVQNPEIAVPTDAVRPDITEPEVCELALVSQDTETGEVTLELTASDAQSGILYYSYSIDDGVSYSELLPWQDPQEQSQDSRRFTIQIADGVTPVVCVRAYNGYDLYSVSNTLPLQTVTYPEVLPEPAAEEPAAVPEITESQALEAESDAVIQSGKADAEKTQEALLQFLLPAVGAAFVLFLVTLSVSVLLRKRRKHRHKRRRNKSHKQGR